MSAFQIHPAEMPPRGGVQQTKSVQQTKRKDYRPFGWTMLGYIALLAIAGRLIFG